MAESLKELKNQYEAYPYPRREPLDERKRLVRTTMDSLDLVNYFCFEGKKDFSKGFRVLVAGGGTGDSTTYIAEQLRGSNVEICYLDLSQASLDIAKKRAEIRGLENIKFIRGSLLSLPEMDIGKFDYINCIGVLHHLEDPGKGMAALRSVLNDDGAMAVMLYGKYGRTAVYQMQELMRMVNKNTPAMDKKVANTKKILKNLPKSNWFRHNEKDFMVDILNLGDIGIYDLFLSPQDRAYSVPEIYDMLDAHGLNLLSFSHHEGKERFVYNPSFYIKDKELLNEIEKFSLREKHAIAELVSGTIKRHSFYVSARKKRLPGIGNADNVPFISSRLYREGIYEMLQGYFNDDSKQSMEILIKSAEVRVQRQKYTKYVLKHLDGKNTVGQIVSLVRNDDEFKGANVAEFDIYKELSDIYNAFNAFGWMLVRDKNVPDMVKTDNELQKHLMEKSAAWA